MYPQRSILVWELLTLISGITNAGLPYIVPMGRGCTDAQPMLPARRPDKICARHIFRPMLAHDVPSGR